MEALSNLFYFIVALGILVTFHEFGHFWVARKLGVRVLTFSVGFGKPIWRKLARDGVVYQVGMIPLGGYVKMLDERDGDVSDKDVHQAFNRKPVWRRFAIVAAGPIANFLLAILLYWWVFGLGITDYNTRVGEVASQSIAESGGLRPGDVITKVDGAEVSTSTQLVRRLALRLGNQDTLHLQVVNQGSARNLELELKNWRVDPTKPDILGSLGIRHQASVQKPLLDFVTEGGPADKAGLQKGDLILSIDGNQINYWNEMVKLVQARPDETVNVEVN